MERVGALIERLNELHGQHAEPSKLLVAAQMLLAELQQQDKAASQSRKVAVILPSVNVQKPVNGDSAVPAPPSKPIEISVEPPPPVAAAEVKKEVTAPAIPAKEEEVKQKDYYSWAFDPVKEVPTLAHQDKEVFELNEVMAVREESLNERLRVEKIELASVLNESPIRDLKKAIGINDRYLFVNDLFRGDETMYERSIKTINSFNILAEAEYWIQRELKVKLGWNDSSDSVRLFDQLVRRRFS
ncbi:hypothetical protein [Foetidibacter luteolus]|uniref:hypothetical protein n=1 Tax=Foetidibacter luteolus TaxID=2608880 RepID=UPI00129A9CF0|nr:hypothetical protein [Foetidibacter luteolus]